MSVLAREVFSPDCRQRLKNAFSLFTESHLNTRIGGLGVQTLETTTRVCTVSEREEKKVNKLLQHEICVFSNPSKQDIAEQGLSLLNE